MSTNQITAVDSVTIVETFQSVFGKASSILIVSDINLQILDLYILVMLMMLNINTFLSVHRSTDVLRLLLFIKCTQP